LSATAPAAKARKKESSINREIFLRVMVFNGPRLSGLMDRIRLEIRQEFFSLLSMAAILVW
jgi:hypothetical protein